MNAQQQLLIASYWDNALSEEEQAELLDLLRADPDVRAEFMNLLHLRADAFQRVRVDGIPRFAAADHLAAQFEHNAFVFDGRLPGRLVLHDAGCNGQVKSASMAEMPRSHGGRCENALDPGWLVSFVGRGFGPSPFFI